MILYSGLTKPYKGERAILHLKTRLILKLKQDPGFFLKSRLNWVTKFNNTGLFVTKLFLLASLIFAPYMAHAGFFSFIQDLFSYKSIYDTVDKKSTQNLQSMPLLRAALNNDPNPSKGGGNITIVNDVALLSESGPSGKITEESEFSSDQISIYVVREGDNLSQIASMFDVSVNTIIWANDIKRGSLIKPGATLVILPITGISHEVKKGETLKSIVKKYKGDLEEVLKYNDLTSSSVLSVGETIIIPDGEGTKPKTYSSSNSSSSRVRGANGPSYVGYYRVPVNGRKSQGLHGYNGVDFAAPSGTPVVASASGQVIISKNYGWNGGYGNYVVIKHNNGTQTLYAHNNKNIVSVGQFVVQGQVIGYVGSTGRSTGPHVHFEVRGAKNPF